MTTSRRTLLEVSSTVVLTAALSLLIFTPNLLALDVPWGRSDMTQYYFSAAMRGWVAPALTTHYGFPGGMDANVYAEVDIAQNAIAQLVNAVVGNPFVGLNLVLLLSFPAVAALAYWAIRLVGLNGPVAVALATAYTFIPFHFGRGIGHLHLATMFGATAGMVLVLLLISGRGWDRLSTTRGRARIGVIATLVGLVVLASWSGLYYAAYTVVLLLAGVVWRIAQGDSWRRTLFQLGLPFSIVALVGIGFLPVILSRLADPTAAAVGLRDPMDAVALAGNLVVALLPQPYSLWFTAYNDAVWQLVGGPLPDEARLMSNFGSVITTIALGTMIVGLVVRYRHQSLGRRVARSTVAGVSVVPLPAIAYLLVVSLLFFVPWGLNFLASSLVTAQVRAWNRLVVDILLLFVLGAASTIAENRWVRNRFVSFGVAGLVTIIVVVEGILPWRWLYDWAAADGRERLAAAEAYAADVNRAVPGTCGVLTLPVMAYPNNGPVHNMDDYDHLLIGMTNPDKSISFGALRGSPGESLQAGLAEPTTREQIHRLRFSGFCGIHVDTFGYEDPESILGPVRELLGEPVATGADGRWRFFALP